MKKMKYLLVMLFVFICSCIKVNAADFVVQINTTQDVLNQYSDYTLKLSMAIRSRASWDATPHVYQVSYDSVTDSIEFDDDGVAYLDVHLTNLSTDITIHDISSYDKLKSEFDETKESSRMTGQSAMIDENTILGGYFMTYDHMQIWNIESKDVITNISFKKYFEDTGFETYRPASSTFYLYNKKDLNNIVATTSISYGDNSVYEFDGIFTNVPKFDTDGSEIEYTIIEENIPYYSNSTDSKYGLKIDFNNQTRIGQNSILRLYYKENETNKLYSYTYDGSYVGDVTGAETRELIINSGLFTDTTLTLADLVEYAALWADFPSIEEIVGNRYPESRHPYPLGESHVWHYKSSLSNHSQDFYLSMRTESWGGHFGLLIDNISSIGTDNILTSTINLRDLEVTKKWEDTGYESFRPNNVTFKIYDKNDMNTVVKTVTLNKADNEVDANTWKYTITNLPKYDENSQEIEYVIVEEAINNYFTLYDYPDEFNGLKIQFSPDTMIEASVCYFENSSFENKRCLDYPGQGYEQSISTQNGYGAGPLTNQTLYIPTKYFRIYMRTSPSFVAADFIHKAKIESISLTKTAFPSNTESSSITNNAYSFGLHSYADYLDFSIRNDQIGGTLLDFSWDYEWKGSVDPQGNATIVRNLINLKDVEFIKKWNDKGFESFRPESVTFQLYNKNDLNTVVKEVDLTSSAAVAGDQYTWNGIFENVPKYNADGSEIEYIIKEKPVDNYLTTYTMDNIKGFLVTFDNDSYANTSIKFATIMTSPSMHFSVNFNIKGLTNNYIKNLANKTIYIPVSDIKRFLIDFSNLNATQGNDYGFKITSIVPVTYDSDNYTYSSGPGFYYLDEYNYFSGDNYPESTHPNNGAQIYVYSYEPLTTSFVGADTITNEINLKKVEITKKWVDNGNEKYRPDSIQINIYNANDMNTPVITDTLSISDKKDDYTWYKSYNLPKYDDERNEIDYVVVETPINNYSTYYAPTEEFNGLEIKFHKNNTASSNSFFVFYPLNDSTLALIAKSSNYFIKTSGENILADGSIIRIPAKEFYLFNVNSDVKIDYVKPIIMDANEFLYSELPISSFDNYDISEITAEEYLNIDNSHPVWHYTLDKFNNPVSNAYNITNETEFTTYDFYKVWDDDGYSYARPDKIKFSLYNKLDDSLVKEIYLTENDIDILNPLVWKGIFDGIPKNNIDGSAASYYVKEEILDSYTTSYESLNQNGDENVVKNTVKLVNITIDKVDEDENKLSNAKIIITTLDGTKVTDFITNGNEKVLTLPVGEYIIVEEYAPEGYEVTDDIKLKISSDGKIYTDGNETYLIKIVDKKIKEDEIIPNEENPKTLDNLSKYLTLFILSILSFMITIIVITRNKKRNA